MLNGLVVGEDGTKRWYKDGQLHREDGPALELTTGHKAWYQNSKRHREDGPAIEWVTGSRCWYYKDIYIDSGVQPDPALWGRVTSVEANGGPLLNGCIIDGYRSKRWYKDDQLHREDGPSVERSGGLKEWHLDGQLLGYNTGGFWELWDRLTDEQRANPTLLKYIPC